MRIVFFGTPEFAVPSLRALLEEGFDVAAVVTQPDRPQGRSRSQLVPPPVKVVALEEGLPVLQPERPVGAFAESLRAFDADLGVVVAYGHILRPEILAIPRLGMLNVHASLLPKLRGAAPIQWAILNGEETTGVSIMQMEAGLDTGPVFHRIETEVAPDETAGELTERLAELGAGALVEALTLLQAGAASAEPQDHGQATLAPKIDRALARLDWSRDAASLARAIRAFDPEPGAWALLAIRRSSSSAAASVNAGGEPGTVLHAGDTLHDRGTGRRRGGRRSAARRQEADASGRLDPGTRDRGRPALHMRPLPRLHAVTDATVLARDDFPIRAAAIAAAGSAVALHARDRSASAARLTTVTERLLALARPTEASVFVNARPDIAAALDAQGVQLGPAISRRVTRAAPRPAGRADRCIGARARGSRRRLRRRRGFPGARECVRNGEPSGSAPARAPDGEHRCAPRVAGHRDRRGHPGAGAEVREAGAYGVAAIPALWQADDVRPAALALLSALARRTSEQLTL